MPARRNTVLQGDCLKLFQSVGDGEVDLVFADPPFNIGYSYDIYDDRRRKDEYLAWCRKWMMEIRRVLKPSGSFWLAIGDEYAAELKVAAQSDAGFTCRTWVIWYYTFGVNCVRGFSRSHTHLLHFVSDAADFVFNGDNPAARVPSARQLVYADHRANPKGRLPDNTWIYRPQDAPIGSFAPSHDTWYVARVAGTFKEREGFHGCQMPEQILGRIIRVSSNPRDLVLDPFAGSGTTLTVAKKLGRQWLGFELSKSYVSRIQQRLDTAKVGDLLEGPDDSLKSSPPTSKGRSQGRVANARLIPQLDADIEKAIVESYKSSCRGESSDYVLCDPELNHTFVESCKKKGIAGSAYVWNRAMLRLRKSKKLPNAGTPRKRLTFQEMDRFSFASEIAMQTLAVDYQLTLDDMLCDPMYAAEFDRVARDFAPGFSPFEYRWAAMAIRKRARDSIDIARTKFSDWTPKQLGPSKALTQFLPPTNTGAGVYLFKAEEDSILYVGEAIDVHYRIEVAVDSASPWQRLGLASMHFIPAPEQSPQHGLQSRVLTSTSALLNSSLLRCDRTNAKPNGLQDRLSVTIENAWSPQKQKQ